MSFGYAETLGLDHVAFAGDLVALLGERTRLGVDRRFRGRGHVTLAAQVGELLLERGGV